MIQIGTKARLQCISTYAFNYMYLQAVEGFQGLLKYIDDYISAAQ